MPAGSVISQNFSAALHKSAWSKFTREGMEAIPQVHRTYLNIQASGKPFEQEVLYSGLPQVPKVGSDTVQTPLVDFKISPPVTYRHDEYRYQYVYTKVAADDDQYGAVTDVVGTMGEGAAYTIEQVAASVLNEGENAAAFTTWDGKAIFAINHNLVGSDDTYSNITAAGGPTYATLQVIYSYFKRVLNDQGFYTPVEVESIQVAPELAPLWRQLLSANAAYSRLAYTTGKGGGASYTATDNDSGDIPNVYASLGLSPDKVVENPYLSTLEDTIVIGRGHRINMFMREAPNSDTYDINDPKAIAHRIQMRLSVGATDARRVLLIPGS